MFVAVLIYSGIKSVYNSQNHLFPAPAARVCRVQEHLNLDICCVAGVNFLEKDSPSQALPRQIPLFVTCGDIFPRSGGSLSSQGEPSRKVYR